jgi:fructose-bisphosphate aldolase class II
MSKKVHYSEIGFSNTKAMLRKALEEGYAVPGYNFNNLEQLQAILIACNNTRSPVILQVSKGARNYANKTLLRYMAEGGLRMIREMGGDIPIALHLDHGDSFELCKECIESGFSSVMIDGSALPFEENVELTKKVVEYAHQYEVSVEGELGILKGVEDNVSSDKEIFTDPDKAVEFVERTGVDSLAIAIGTSHGAYKFKLKEGEKPRLRFDILEEIEKKLPDFPIVLHGASSVLQEYVDIINRYGGDLEGAAGVPEDELRKASKTNICKINIDTDSRLAMTSSIREYLYKHPKEFDPRKYLGYARENLIKLIERKNIEVLGSAYRY